MTTNAPARWTELLEEAVSKPGTVSRAYSAFHDYSLGNQILAYFQVTGRGQEVGPIATYPRWKALGRQVRKGEKALTLCMPVTFKTKGEPTAADPKGEAGEEVRTGFMYRPSWYTLAQTDAIPGAAPYEPEGVPARDWSADRAAVALKIEQVPYHSTDGNCQGYARERTVAVSPVAAHPIKTTIHEFAHVELGHTAEGVSMSDDERTPRSIREVEAEAVALLVTESLGIAGADDARGYIQHWNGGEPITEKSARKIFAVADRIIKAGQPIPPKES